MKEERRRDVNRLIDKIVRNNTAILDEWLQESAKYINKKGNIELVELLILLGANNCEYALQQAAYFGYFNLVKKIIEIKGISVVRENRKALVCASEKGHLRVVRELIKTGVYTTEDYNHALVKACGIDPDYVVFDERPTRYEKGHQRVVKELIKAGADPTIWRNMPLKIACECGSENVVKELIKTNAYNNDDYCKAAAIACENGKVETLKILINEAVNVFDELVERACKNGNAEILKILIEADSSVAEKQCLWMKILIKRGHVEAAKEFIKLIQNEIKGTGFLNSAIESGSLEMVRLVISLGVEIDEIKAGLIFAILEAASYSEKQVDKVKIVKELIKVVPDVNFNDESLILIVMERINGQNEYEIVTDLLKAGAKVTENIIELALKKDRNSKLIMELVKQYRNQVEAVTK